MHHRITVALSHAGLYSAIAYKMTFDDVPSGHWAARALQALAAKHIVKGVTDSRFYPAEATTRAEFVTLLVHALHLQASGTDATFTDVRSDAWYADAIAAAVKAGIVAGKDANRFAPEERVTRMEMAAMIVRALGLSKSSGPATYADADDIPQWAMPYIAAVSEARYMQGRSDNRFAPRQEATRAEAAQLVYNLLNDNRK
ncbi:S-layer homology domain-containing protein [Cohnella ginsengisoli]|uniref:S-layer homology domain-containing protein n=1 Tax=Cohnella ginsengisoli TaxID=425004 RepID=A0A9X4KJF4_9BACL|nr:S-layer homology domain-containing protein [Cohnella ginsengisoli]MDG0793334.1 S-layer homology domain-containing protein [Cohnella ginsengisoli]